MTQEPSIAIPALEARTLDRLFLNRAAHTPGRTAYLSFDTRQQQWVGSSWNEIAHQVGRWQSALCTEDLQPGDRVAIALRNSIEWVIFEQAALGLGLVVVPLYTNDRPANVGYILEDAGVKLLLLQDSRHWSRLAESLDSLPELRRVVLLDNDQPSDDHRICFSADWLPTEAQALQHRDGDPGGLATIVYTSGTTGRPKGVMLSHGNILANVQAAHSEIDFQPDDLFLSFLPLSHMLERTAGYYLPMVAGVAVAHSRSIPQLAEDMHQLHPTVMISVPRIFERIHTRLIQTLQRGSSLRRWLFHKAVKVGWQRFEWAQGRRRWEPSLLIHPLLQRLVGDKLLARMGGRLRLVVSGGAALPKRIGQVFIGLGLNVIQGYGLTETAPVISCNRPDNNLPESVGPALPGIEVRIGEQDELLVRGPNLMLGYWNRPDAVDSVIDAEGWFHTGDQARINAGGHIFITGRLKDILVLSNGEKIPPTDMEMAIGNDPLFEQVMIVGEGRPYLCALAVLDETLWSELALSLKLDPAQPASLRDKGLQQNLIRRIATLCGHFPIHAKVRRIHLSLEPWSVENGLMTATLKIKREQVQNYYDKEIAELYGQGPAVQT